MYFAVRCCREYLIRLISVSINTSIECVLMLPFTDSYFVIFLRIFSHPFCCPFSSYCLILQEISFWLILSGRMWGVTVKWYLFFLLSKTACNVMRSSQSDKAKMRRWSFISHLLHYLKRSVQLVYWVTKGSRLYGTKILHRFLFQ